MSKSDTTGLQTSGTTGTEYRPDYILVGIDTRGASHCWDRQTDTIHIVHQDGGRERKLLDAGTIDDYVEAVADAHGWDHQRYYPTMGDTIEDRVTIVDDLERRE